MMEAKGLTPRQLETLRTVAEMDGKIGPFAGNAKYHGKAFHGHSADALVRRKLIDLRETGRFYTHEVEGKFFSTRKAALAAALKVDPDYEMEDVEAEQAYYITPAGKAALS